MLMLLYTCKVIKKYRELFKQIIHDNENNH